RSVMAVGHHLNAAGDDLKPFVLHLRADGTPDPSFGAGGLIELVDDGLARSVARLPDGGVLVGGTRASAGGPKPFLARLRPL
ncbi:MAG TPA: hypothetical protein VFS00_00810, partial [Polyangiaceae bacterium]|nr:hypothetical protein [Polyangiaceae bacterium]